MSRFYLFCWAHIRILEQVTIYRRLRIGRDGYFDQSEAYDISTIYRDVYENTDPAKSGIERNFPRILFL